MSLDLREHFSAFRKAAPGRIHLAAHSHHYWPDAAVRAHARAAEDAARLADRKWEYVFGELMPRVRQGIAALLNLPDPATIAFAPNTHDLLCRLLSSLDARRPARVLTSDGEFHSFHRQIARLEEEGLVVVERVPTAPHGSFAERFAVAAAREFDLVFVSQVFFDSGALAGDLDALVGSVAAREALVIVDGYHGFMALPTDLSRIADRAFYLAGGYKYAMAGEGVCFMHCPPGHAPRPRDTGWFAAMQHLSDRQTGVVPYAADGSRFLGATFDPSGLYRLAAVFDWMAAVDLTVPAIRNHALELQSQFLAALRDARANSLTETMLVLGDTDRERRGNFLAFETPSAPDIHARLSAADIVADVRGHRLRVGFGCYHTSAEVGDAAHAVARALA